MRTLTCLFRNDAVCHLNGPIARVSCILVAVNCGDVCGRIKRSQVLTESPSRHGWLRLGRG